MQKNGCSLFTSEHPLYKNIPSEKNLLLASSIINFTILATFSKIPSVPLATLLALKSFLLKINNNKNIETTRTRAKVLNPKGDLNLMVLKLTRQTI